MPAAPKQELFLMTLKQGLPAITPAYGEALAEAGAVCFEDQGHLNGVELAVSGSFTATFKIYWPEVTGQMLRCWNDEEFTTEQAAYGLSFLLIRALTEHTIIRRSRKGTGFDYWLGREGDEESLPFQNTARLEVSGIRKGDYNKVKTRVKQKLRQVSPSDRLELPAYIVVVEFRTPLSQVVKK